MKFCESIVLLLLNSLCICSCGSIKSLSNFNYAGLLPCRDSKDCESLKNASCVNGLCNCGRDFYVCEENVDHTIKVNSIGGECNSVSLICNSANSECGPDNVCACKEGFLPSDDSKQCVKGLGTSCISGQECSSDFSRCLNSKCSCEETHVAKGSRCLAKAQSIDDPCEDDVQCTPLLGMESQCSKGVCSCKSDHHYRTREKSCVKNLLLGDICETSEDCHQPGEESISQLMCIEGVCKCKLSFTEEKGYCIENNSAPMKDLKFEIVLINVLLMLVVCT